MRTIWTTCTLVVALAVLGHAQSPGPAQRRLELSFANGSVTLIAQNVTVREILIEWQKKTGCVFDGAEKLVGGPITTMLQFENKPEATVMTSLLSSAAGVMLVPRTNGALGLQAVYIMATASRPSSFSAPTSPAAVPLASPGSPDDEIPPVVPIPSAPPNAGGPQAQPPANNSPPRGPVGPGVFVPVQPINSPATGTNPSTPSGSPQQQTPPPSTGPGRGGGAGGR